MFEGEAGGRPGRRSPTGELVFNTAMSGYQEVITDPSYAGQVIAFTYPHIGNYGTNAADDEAARPSLPGRGRPRPDRAPSNWRATEALEDFLIRHGVPGLTGIDTRRLTRHVRNAGAMPVRLRDGAARPSCGRRPRRRAGTDGLDLVSGVTTAAPPHRAHRRRRAGCASWPTTSG